MYNKKIIRFLAVLLFVTAISPLYAQSQTSDPSKFDMKKDGDGDGVKNK